MIELGYLQINKKGVHTTSGKRYLTKYSATNKLLDLFPKFLGTAMPAFVPQAQNINLIRVQQTYETEVKGVKLERKKLLDFQETSRTKLMRENFQKINDNLSKFWFDLRLDDDDFAKMQDQMLSKKKQREQGVALVGRFRGGL